MSDVELIGLLPSTYMRTAMMVCEGKGVGYSTQPVDFRAPEYRALHPFGKVPVLRHGEVRLYEALAISTYIDEAFEGPALQPDTPLERARMMQWISATNDYLYTSIIRHCVLERFVKPMRGGTPDEAVIAAAKPVIGAHLDVVERALLDQPYLAGDQISLADYFLAPILYYFALTPEGREMMPALEGVQRWTTRLEQSPNYEGINIVG